MGETRAISQFVEKTAFPQLPPEVIQKAKGVILDTLGCAVAGHSLAREEFQWIFGLVKDLGGAPRSTVWIEGLKTSAPQAALVNGTLVHTIDFDDTHLGSIAHFGASVVPSCLALAEDLQLDGKAILTAMVLAYEIGGRVGKAVMPSHYQFWHPTGTLGAIAVGVAAAKLLNLSAEKIDQAIGLAADAASGMRYGIDFGDFSKSLHPGLAGWHGIMAASLIHRGATGPRGLLEYPTGFCRAYGAKPAVEALTEGLGKSYEILTDSLKAFPTILCSHTPIQGTLQIVTEHRLRMEEIESIHFRVSPTAPGQGLNDSPQTPLAARLSIPYCVARAVADGNVSMDQFGEEKLKDHKIREFMKRITVESDPAFKDQYPGTLAAWVEVKTKDGSIFKGESIYPKGHPRNPMTEEEIKEKFRRLCAATLRKGRIEAMIEKVFGLENVNNIGDLIFLLVR
jgi:2-methylcitrate dehydratase PrpD